MCELLIAKFEKEDGQDGRGKRYLDCRSLPLLAALLLLTVNLLGTHRLELRLGINLAVFIAIFAACFFPRRQRGWEGEDIEEYMRQLDCMEKILRGLDIDDYNKLGFVMDGVKMRLDSEEKKQWRRERISVLGILSFAVVFSLCWGGGILAGAGWEWILDIFLVSAILLMCWLYACSVICPGLKKIKWLYRILMHVMVTRM